MFFEALLLLARKGEPLRKLPAEFGAWDAVYNRFRRRVASGAMARLVEATTVRAHRHAAGAPRKPM
jgi:transposase